MLLQDEPLLGLLLELKGIIIIVVIIISILLVRLQQDRYSRCFARRRCRSARLLHGCCRLSLAIVAALLRSVPSTLADNMVTNTTPPCARLKHMFKFLDGFFIRVSSLISGASAGV
jgi:hypothetical protein